MPCKTNSFFFKEALTSRLASLLMVFKAAGVQLLPCPTRVGGRGFAAQVGERLWLVLAGPWAPSSSASRAEDTPSQRERSPPSFSVIRSKFYLYVCFFSTWPASVAGSCGLHRGAKQVVLSWLCLRASWLAQVYLSCCYLCEVGSLFHKLPAVGLHHKLVFKVWLWSEKSQRATVKLTS